MRSKKLSGLSVFVVAGALLLAACSGGASKSASNASSPATSGSATKGNPNAVLTLAEQTMPTFTRNFNPFVSTALPGTLNVIYEPLMVYNSVKSTLVPWLATKYRWSNDLKTLTLTLRKGVKWSDGKPFTASDVAFTFNLLKTSPGVTSSVLPALVGKSAYVDSVVAKDPTTVVFTFNRPYTPGLYELVSQVIVPEHIWKNVKNVVAFTNDNPIGTGPFTQVVKFSGQAFELDKNPHYWQTGRPHFKGIVWKAFAGANAASLAMVNGEIDWSNLFIPDPEKNFVAKDPKHRYFIYEEGPNMGILAMNIDRKPFDNPNVRRAISMAINREQVVTVGEAGVVGAPDVTGLTQYYKSWKVSDSASLADWATYNVAKANRLLDQAGLKRGPDGIRVADGKPMKYDVMVLPAPNWIADLQIVTENLKAVGIAITPKPNPNYPEWLKTQETGDYNMIFGIINGNATPYQFYRQTMSSKLLAPEGTVAQGNYTRYAGGKADSLLEQFASARTTDQQMKIAHALERVFAAQVPAVPLVPLGGMGLINTIRFTGFPTKQDYYASAQPNPAYFPDLLLVLTRISPR